MAKQKQAEFHNIVSWGRQAGKNGDYAVEEDEAGHDQQNSFLHGIILADMSSKFRNVTIAGLPGAGSSTLGINLAKAIGWEYFSGGDFMREYAIAKGLFDKNNQMHHPATVYSDDFDRQVDYSIRERLVKDNGLIVDSWLSGF